MENLQLHVQNIFVEAEMDPEDTVHYKQWTHGGQSKLQSLVSTVGEFISILCQAADKATNHHFISKSQASHLRQLKDNLPPNQAIILLDFAENY